MIIERVDKLICRVGQEPPEGKGFLTELQFLSFLLTIAWGYKVKIKCSALLSIIPMKVPYWQLYKLSCIVRRYLELNWNA